MPSVQGGKKRVSDPLGLEMVVSCHMGAEKQNLGSQQEQQVLLTTELSLQPIHFSFIYLQVHWLDQTILEVYTSLFKEYPCFFSNYSILIPANIT